MVQNWEPGVQYNLGDKVQYHGSTYNIIQAHRSQSDWTPDIVPALWGKVPGGGGGEHHGQQQEHHGYQPQKPEHHGGGQEHHNQPPGYQAPQQGYQAPQQGGYKPVDLPKPDVHIDHEEKKTNWYDLSDDRKKQLEIGGGIAAGAGLLAGGYMLWKKHDKDEDEKKNLVWGLQNWATDAQKRSAEYFQGGATGPATWIFVQGKQIPQGAIQGGEEGGAPVYIARAFVEGGLHIGKASQHCVKGALVGYDRDEHEYDTYEVLLGDMRALKWVDINSKFDLGDLNGARPVEGGREKNGDQLYIAQANYNGETIPGKVSEKIRYAHVPKDGKEHEVKSYRVLCYA